MRNVQYQIGSLQYNKNLRENVPHINRHFEDTPIYNYKSVCLLPLPTSITVLPVTVSHKLHEIK